MYLTYSALWMKFHHWSWCQNWYWYQVHMPVLTSTSNRRYPAKRALPAMSFGRTPSKSCDHACLLQFKIWGLFQCKDYISMCRNSNYIGKTVVKPSKFIIVIAILVRLHLHIANPLTLRWIHIFGMITAPFHSILYVSQIEFPLDLTYNKMPLVTWLPVWCAMGMTLYIGNNGNTVFIVFPFSCCQQAIYDSGWIKQC